MLRLISSIHRSTNRDSSGFGVITEHTYSSSGWSGDRPTARQNESRSRDGVAIEPLVVALRAGDRRCARAGMPCHSIASRFCVSFQRRIRSGTFRSSALLDRWSQLNTQTPVRRPSARAARR